MNKILAFVKREVVLCVALLLAVVSSFIVKPDAGYIDYVDFRTLAILFSLMCVMAGLQELGVFKKTAEGLLKSVSGERGIAMVLVLLCFFFSMLITNDVALITFVPFTFTTLRLSGEETYKKLVIPVVVLQTVAANLGSMLTPIGNPQNLYLYSKAQMGFGEFILLMLPYTVAAFAGIVLFVIFKTSKPEKNGKEKKNQESVPSKRLTVTEMFANSQTKYHSLLIMYILLFVVALFVVLRVLPYQIMFFITLILVLLSDRKTLLKVDYSLLLTFVGFFVFIGNMGRIPQFSDFLQRIVNGHETLTAVVSSQAISNVPAALLLSGFTTNYRELIVGANIGGLGTLIASMASLISYKMIAKEEDVDTGKYFGQFTLKNIEFLVIMIAVYVVLLLFK